MLSLPLCIIFGSTKWTGPGLEGDKCVVDSDSKVSTISLRRQKCRYQIKVSNIIVTRAKRFVWYALA